MALSQFSFTKPGTDPSTAKFARDRQIAEALAQQSITADPTQMVGNYAIRQTALNPLAKIAQALASRKIAERADTGEREYQQQMGQNRARMIAEAIRAGQGQEARPAIEAPSEELGGGPGRPDMPAQAPDPARTYMMLAGASDPALQQIGLQGYTESLKPRVVGRTMVDGSGRPIAVDETWQKEQEAARVSREQELTARREERRQELEMRLQDARLSREERANLQRELQRNQLEARQEMLRVAAALRPAGGSGNTRAPVGYRFSSDGETLEPIPGGPKDGSNAKPLPTQALKLQQAELDAIGTAASLSSDLTSIKSQIDGGQLRLGPINNLVAQGRNIAGISNPNSQNFASFQANLERLRNESLRLNKGVQTEGDSQRAWNELIKNINDPGVVKQRIDEVVALNERAVQLRKMNIDVIRSNYGAGPMDTSGYTNQPASVGANRGAAGSWDGTDRRKPTAQPGAVMKFDANGDPVK